MSLLSLIPRLIKRCAGCLAGGVWVWLGGTLLLLGSDMVRLSSGGRRRARTLLGPEGTPVWCVLGGTIPGLVGLTHPGCPVVGGVVVVAAWWFGVWLCVECCIVDASILFVVKCVRAHGGCLGIRSR